MKLKREVSTENYSLTINKEYFLKKYGKESLKTKRMFYLCYKTYLSILELCERVDREEDKEKISQIMKKIEHYENRLQQFWDFKPNSNFHIYWNMPLSCCCSKRYNHDRSIRRVYNSSCKIHGHLV